MNKRFENIFNMVSYKPQLRTLESRGKVAKQATEGAVIIANGLTDERYKKISWCFKAEEIQGTIFDYVTVIDKD